MRPEKSSGPRKRDRKNHTRKHGAKGGPRVAGPGNTSRFSIQYPEPRKNQMTLGSANQKLSKQNAVQPMGSQVMGSLQFSNNSEIHKYLERSKINYDSKFLSTRINRMSVMFNPNTNIVPKSVYEGETKEKFKEIAYPVTYCMIVGLNHVINTQILLSNQTDYAEKSIQLADYREKLILPFPLKGSIPHGTPKHDSFYFKFTEYAPKVFRHLRSLHGVIEEGYRDELNNQDGFISFSTNSKSGSFFFHTTQGSYIVKSASKYEADLLVKLLPSYITHLAKHKDSLLVRFCGLYHIRVPDLGKKVHFIIMKSVYSYADDMKKQVNKIFDLKGSKVGRQGKPTDEVKKDMDILDEIKNKNVNFNGLHLGIERDNFVKTIITDAKYLASNNIMDYSMLLAIFDKKKFKRETRAYNVNTRSFVAFDADNPTFWKRGRRDVPKTKKAYIPRYAAYDALKVSNGGLEPTGDSYFMGIIDILQEYTWQKRLENLFKSLKDPKNRKEISAVNSEKYHLRFVNFMKSIVRKQPKI